MRTKRHSVRFAVLAVAALAGLTACTTGSLGGERPDSTPGNPDASATAQMQTITTGLDAPWSIAFHGDTPLVSERGSARILELDDDERAREVATIDGVVARGEAGLLGIAVHDEYLYVYFTASDENRIERYPLSGEPGALALGPGETIIDGIPAASNHDGGRIAIGPDGMLYATTGDAGNRASAQDPDSLAGKILRLTPDGEIPDDNPFPGSPVYTLGHRNPQGIAWASDGMMYASEFGQNTWDELNVIEAGGNYGWPQVEGIAGEPGFIDPVQQWSTADASPSGIAIMQVEGAGETIYIANLRGERLREVPLSALSTFTERFVREHGRLRDVVAAPDGTLWILTNNTDGRGSPAPDDDRILSLSPVAER